MLVCVLLFATFSITASAEETTNFKFSVGYDDSFWGIGLEEHDNGTNWWSFQEFNSKPQSSWTFDPIIVIEKADGSLIAKRNEKVTLGLNNIGFLMHTTSNGENFTYYMKAFDSMQIDVKYTDGTVNTWTSAVTHKFNSTDNLSTWKVEFTPYGDVSSITFRLSYNPYNRLGSNILNHTIVDLGYYTDNLGAYVTVQSEEAGLLSGLLGFVQNIFNKIGEMFDSITEGFANIGTWFAELPGKLWSAIETGLKNLFIPSEEYIASFKVKFDQLLENKLGAVYQVVNITLESWDSIMDADQQNIIEFPSSKITFKDGTEFSFGGYNVDIVPEGFGSIVDILKVLVGVVCTAMFINGLRKRYDEIMGVEQ